MNYYRNKERNYIKTALFIVLINIFFALGNVLKAQQYGSIEIQDISGSITGLNLQETFSVNVIDSLTGNSMSGATIQLKNVKDSITISLSNRRIFRFRGFADSVDVVARYMGYNVFRQRVKIEPPALLTIRLSERHIEVAKLIVKGKSMAMVLKGDTIQFNASAVKTFDGSTMEQLLKLMPGMETNGNSLSFNGKAIKYLYIDKKKLFGDNIEAAMKNITADDVVNVQVYEELEEFDALNKVKNVKKITVANVNTKTKKSGVKNTKISVTPYSFYTNNNGNSNIFSFDNISTKVGNTFTINGKASHSHVQEKKDDKIQLISSYSRSEREKYDYNSQYYAQYSSIKDYSSIERNYLEENDINYSSTKDENRSLKKQLSFRTEQSYSKYLRDKSNLDTHLYVQFANHNDKVEAFNVVWGSDKLMLNGTRLDDNNKVFDYSFYLSNYFAKYFNSVDISLNNTLKGYFNGTNEDIKKSDSLYVSGSNIILEGDGKDNGNMVSEGISFSKVFFDKITLGAYCGTEVSNYKRRLTYLDMLSMEVDTTLSKKYKVNEVNTTLLLKSYATFGKCHYTLSAQKLWDREKRYEYFPDENNIYRNKDVMSYTANFEYDISKFINVDISYNRSLGQMVVDEFAQMDKSQSFSIDMLRSNMVMSSPLEFVAGDEKLKEPINNVIDLSCGFVMPAIGVISLTATSSFTNRYVGCRKEYFSEDTYLEAYDYIVPAGANLTIYQNLGTAKQFKVNLNYSQFIDPIKCTFSFNSMYKLQYVPYNIGEENFTNKLFFWRVGGKLETAFSKKITLSLRYSHDSKESGYAHNRITQDDLNCYMKLKIAKRLNLSIHQIINKQHSNFSTNNNYTSFVTNSSLSYTNLLHGKMGISLSVSDIFDKCKSWNVTYFDNYIETVNNAVYGRSIGLHLNFKFDRK